jgi:hypothetical protein
MKKTHLLAALLATVVTALTVAATALAAAPSNTTAPAVSGTPKAGQVLTVSNGSWTGSPTDYSYQWQRCSGSSCSNIANANNKSYTVRAADVGHTLRAVVTASNADGLSTANSNQTATVQAGTGVPVNTVRPTISGRAIVGTRLFADNGTWTGTPTSYRYQWYQCNQLGGACLPIYGAIHRGYTVQLADLGGTLRVDVTARNASGSATARSAPSDVVLAAQVVTTTPDKAPTITFLSLKRLGVRVYVRFRVCDDTAKAVEVVERDSKRGYLAYSRKFSVTPNACVTATRSFNPAPRFRTKGRYTVTLTAIDKSGKASRSVGKSLVKR